ncbi:hypothetical protein OG230_33470 [Streptomyces sp. NBC_00234]|nr:hypothetical protein [Streptomyces sp. NBC_00234]
MRELVFNYVLLIDRGVGYRDDEVDMPISRSSNRVDEAILGVSPR